MIEEEADAAALLKDESVVRPDDAEWPTWAGYVREAWQALRDDRHMGDMGGIGRIYFTAIDRYALRYGLVGQAFDDLLLFIRTLDDVFIQHVNAKRKEQAEQRQREKQ